ncbi:hypothetical protein B0A48_15813 [Cryoendolithus antarcticus]|uniref:CCHC-type domain-containing protein n=1 Tax=Cryoendolithus antarcticus TaxID=1507870 RepID=A0A1V8SI65_9PEZI|nr:hypothetical protein B0A48_15813 [Cryoendolithus antarcticus]
MSGWDDTPTPAAGFGDAWKPDTEKAGNDAWAPDNEVGVGGDGGFSNESKHADGGDAADGGCRNCGADGHFARDCPEPRPEGGNSGLCYNCNEPGHNKSECTNPRIEREFTGTCRNCNQEGHRAADCPTKAPDQCKVCKSEDHATADCEMNRLMAAFKINDDVDAEAAWHTLVEADKEKEVEDIKKAMLQYTKAVPSTTLPELEATFRQSNMNTHLIAFPQEIPAAMTIANFQGEVDQEFVVSIQWSDKPRRAKSAEKWPRSVEENTERLAKAGFVVDSFVPKCRNCDQYGHTKSACTEENKEVEKVVENCVLCNEDGHRARDCTQPRKTGGRGCRNCGQEGHISKECPEPPNMDNVECKNCSEIGHFSRDCPTRTKRTCRNCDSEEHVAKECPEEKNMSRVQCRNCDEMGHTSRDCPKPTDWSRVECSNCGEKGHSYKRCKNEAAAPAGDEGGDGGGW